MTRVQLPRSLVALFPGAPRQLDLDLGVEQVDVATVIGALDARVPGMRDRLIDAGPTLREHINVFVDGERATLATPVTANSVVHVIPAVSGGG